MSLLSELNSSFVPVFYKLCSKCPTFALTHTFPQVFDQNFILKTQLKLK